MYTLIAVVKITTIKEFKKTIQILNKFKTVWYCSALRDYNKFVIYNLKIFNTMCIFVFIENEQQLVISPTYYIESYKPYEKITTIQNLKKTIFTNIYANSKNKIEYYKP